MNRETQHPPEDGQPEPEQSNGDARGAESRQNDERNSFRSQLPPEFQNLSDEELLEAINKRNCELLGVQDPRLANRLLSHFVTMRKFGEAAVPGTEKDVDALAAAMGFWPGNPIETMLAVQMYGVYESAISFQMAAGRPGLSEKQRDLELRRARDQMRLFTSQVDSMLKLKAKGYRAEKDSPKGS